MTSVVRQELSQFDLDGLVAETFAMSEAKTPKKRLRRRKLVVRLPLVVLVGGLAGLVFWNKTASEKFAQQMAQSQPSDPDARYRSLVVGTWEDEYQGKRKMTLNQDGTGTMVVELSGWRAALIEKCIVN